MMRTPITYYGGKQRLVKELLALIPEHTLYVEAFVGGGALFFVKEPSEVETLNDLNGDVTNFYCVAQSQFTKLKKLIAGTLHSRATYEEAMQVLENPVQYDPVKRAWAFWVTTNDGFSGKIGSWAVEKKANKVGKTLANKREGFTKEYAGRLKHVQIESKDAIEIIKQYDSPDTFFYLDPPYFNSDCGHYKGYSQSEFRKLLELLSTIKGKFLLSSYPSDILTESVEKCNWRKKEKQQRINVTYQTDRIKTEVMIYNYDTPEKPVVGAVQKNNEKCKRLAHIKVPPPIKKSALTSLEVEEEVPSFDAEKPLLAVISRNNSPDSMKRTHKPRTAVALARKERSETLSSPVLILVNEFKLLYEGDLNNYYVVGKLPMDLGSLQITLIAEDKLSHRKDRAKIDLYERDAFKRYTEQLAMWFYQEATDIEAELLVLTDLLEKHRDKQLEGSMAPFPQNKSDLRVTSPQKERVSITLLQGKGLIKKIDHLLEKAGIAGEESSRKLLFIIGTTYKSTNPLHALIQGSNGSGKSHLINIIGQCLPPEDVMTMARVSSKSFYHYTRNELVGKVLLLQDYEGLDEEARYAFKELQSNGSLSSSTIHKDTHGNLISLIKSVKGHFSSLSATGKSEVYYDGLSLNIAVGVDESAEQTERIMHYQNKKLSGVIQESEEQNAKEQLQNIIRCIKPVPVINPYADKIQLPIVAKNLRRLNIHYHAFVKQVTLLHQYQRKKDKEGRLITEPEDLKIACDILFDAIVLKVDDLDPTLRNFYERMKAYLRQRKEYNTNPEIKTASDTFMQREVRLALNVPKASCFRYMEELELSEYIQRVGGYANRGFKYKMIYWDDMEKVRVQIKKDLHSQLDKIMAEPRFGTPKPAIIKETSFGGSLVQRSATAGN
jgi:site-specific DNA-adenine methylase/predicted GTPase